MRRNKFCGRCGFRFPSEDFNFCTQCGTKRGLYLRRDEFQSPDRPPPAPAQAPAPIISSSSSISTELASLSCSSSSSSGAPGEPPSYGTIFKPPPNSLRKPEKVYGKKALRGNWPSQHKRLLDNYKRVREWIPEGQGKGVLPDGAFNLEDETVRKNLHQFIEENLGKLKSIKGKKGKDYTWGQDDIYKKTKRHLKYLRRKERKQRPQHAETAETSTGRRILSPVEHSPPRVKIEQAHQ